VTSPRVSLTIDCHDPVVLVAFWCTALDYVPEPAPGGHANWLDYWKSIGIPEEELAGVDASTCDSIVDPAGRRPRIWFQVVPETKTGKNRLHLDLDVTQGRSGDLAQRKDAVDVEADRLCVHGARILRTLAPRGADYYAVVLADPEGNEFCVS